MRLIKLEQTLNVQINIPSDYVVISKSEYTKLLDERLEGRWWNMNDIRQRVSCSTVAFTERILDQPKFKKIIDIDNGGFVRYPKKSGERFMFLASETVKFMESNFAEIWKTDLGKEV